MNAPSHRRPWWDTGDDRSHVFVPVGCPIAPLAEVRPLPARPRRALTPRAICAPDPANEEAAPLAEYQAIRAAR
jgi:hypothetical protein